MSDKAVQFLRQTTPYVAGDVAAFPAAKADAYVRCGAAVPYEMPAAEAAEDPGASKASKAARA